MSRIPERVELREVETVMRRIGFRRIRTTGLHLVFYHPDTHATVILPRTRYLGLAHLSQIRRIVDESGTLLKEEFDELLGEEIARGFDEQ
jgi:predicted RNA binding protein YcfA (HicA-like mRNA interferase family)